MFIRGVVMIALALWLNDRHESGVAKVIAVRRSRLGIGQWFAVIFTAAGMLALLVFLVRVGLREAVAISTVLTVFVAVAALLVSALSFSSQRREASEQGLRAARDPSGAERPLRTAALAPPQPLVVAEVLLGMALCTFASDALLRYSTTWPWWVAVAATFLAFAAASSGVRADAIRAAILAVNTLWFFTYSVIIVEYRQSSSPGSIGHLATLSWIGAAANALFLVIALARSFSRRQESTSPLELQPFLLCCLAGGMAVTAIALRGSSNGLWDLAGWIFIGAFLADLVLLLPARTLTGRTLGVQS
jgi:hypothetical protein